MSTIKLPAASGGGSISLKGPSSAGSDTDLLDTSGNLNVSGDIDLVDDKKLLIGTGDDLQIYHDGTRSWVRDSGSGNLIIDTNGSEIDINSGGNAEYMARFIKDGAVELYHDNSKKFETASSGCIVSGDSLKLPDGSAGTPSLTWTDEGNLDTGIFRPAANQIAFSTAGTERVRIDNDGIDVADGNGTTNRTSGSNKGWYVQHGGTTVGRLYQNGTGPEGILELLNDGTQKILVNGDNGTYYGVSTTISALSSERRTKENIISISDSNAWSTLKDIKLYSFSYKNDTNSDTHYGPIVDEIPTDMKVPTSNSDDVGVINTYNSELLLFRAYSTIKQLVAKVETLETKVAALEGS